MVNKSDLCEFCEGGTEKKLIRARFRYKGQTIFINDVPAWVCTHCGEQYFDAPVYQCMEKIAKNRDNIQKTISFPLAEYDMVIS